MCSFYNVSRSGYYSWLRRPETTPKDIRLLKMIEECQAKHKRRYGYRRVTSWLKSEKGLTVNHKKVLKLIGKGGRSAEQKPLENNKKSIRKVR